MYSYIYTYSTNSLLYNTSTSKFPIKAYILEKAQVYNFRRIPVLESVQVKINLKLCENILQARSAAICWSIIYCSSRSSWCHDHKVATSTLAIQVHVQRIGKEHKRTFNSNQMFLSKLSIHVVSSFSRDCFDCELDQSQKWA